MLVCKTLDTKGYIHIYSIHYSIHEVGQWVTMKQIELGKRKMNMLQIALKINPFIWSINCPSPEFVRQLCNIRQKIHNMLAWRVYEKIEICLLPHPCILRNFYLFISTCSVNSNAFWRVFAPIRHRIESVYNNHHI